MKRCSIWAAVLSASVAVPFLGCSHMPTAMLPSSARQKVLDSKMAVAQDLETKKELKKAKAAYESIHKSDPKRALACHRLAIVSYRLGERKEALEYFKKAEELTPENAELLSDYGYALYKQKKYKQAEGVLKKSVSLDPKNERAITRFATVLGTQGKMQDTYTQLCKISTPAEAHEIVAHLHSERGEKQLALKHYQQSLAVSKSKASQKLKPGSREYKVHQQLLKRVEQNIAQLSSDPALKSTHSDRKLVAQSRSQQTKGKQKTTRKDNDFFQKVANSSAKVTDKKKPVKQQKTEVAVTTNSPFRVIQDRLTQENGGQTIENPFLTDPQLAESSFKESQPEKAKKSTSRTDARQKRNQLDTILAQKETRPDTKEKVTFRRLTDQDVNQTVKNERQPVEVARRKTVAHVVSNPVRKNSKVKRSAFELMRELQNELIDGFTPPEEKLVVQEPQFQLVRQSVPQIEENRRFADYSRMQPTRSPFEDHVLNDIGKWNPVDPGAKTSKPSQVIRTISRTIDTQPVKQNQKLMVQNALVSRPKQEVMRPLTATTMCPAAKGEVLVLVQQLESRDIPMLKQSIQRLGAMESAAIAAAPALRSLSKHENRGVRIQSAFSLWKIEGNTDDSIPTLIEAMNSSVESDRSFAAAVLSQIGFHSQELTPILVRSLSDNNDYVRMHTAELLARNSDWKYQAHKTLSDCLQSKDVNIRWLASYSLADLKPQDDRVISALSIALQDKASQVRAGAAYALGEIGPSARRSIPELQKARFDTNSEVRTAAKNALSRVSRVSPPSAN
ncbi:MAG: HEAT repeat domain-containing protein [Planctomycetes bacterium]|nr:HEAT repeat domain-containing protein [Planctomycetota bacterium]MCH9727335.1 HEAT repeat domain-containing protein [Planctomycetota bacterium]MCH9777005.1 HEAT repeat domain-containing protein [Planctomycetota bacterium]